MSTTYEPFDLDINECAQLDADCQGHYFVVLTDYHTYIDHQAELGNLDAADWAYLSYQLGNMEGRLFCNCWTLDDYEQVAVWEQELDEYRESHGGTLFPDLMGGKEE